MNGKLQGMMASHVDDLLFCGSELALETLQSLGQELGFGTIEKGCFVYCGKQIKQLDDFTVEVSMKEYHENLRPATAPLHRRKDVDDPLKPPEVRQLRALLGSLQWLVAQVRFDMGYHLSTLQGEPQVVGTLLKANHLVKKFKQHCDFTLKFKTMNLQGAGIVVVTDSSLGNVTKSGGASGPVLKKLYSQAAHLVLIAEASLANGGEGRFTVLDGRSHRLSCVCRSTYAAELLGAEEAFDTGHYSRGVLSEVFGHRLDVKDSELWPLTQFR